jgi:tripeptide aminopeptidase
MSEKIAFLRSEAPTSIEQAASAPETSPALRLTRLLCSLATIPSPTGSEAACAAAVQAELGAFGLELQHDGIGASIGGDCDNLYCAIPPTTPGVPLFFCAHLDTVPPTDRLEPVVVDGVIRNARPSIIGADNKAAVAVLLDLARVVFVESVPHAGIEFVFTVGEEQGLLGSRAFDASRLLARSGFVFDHPGPIGSYVTAAPSRFIVSATIRGRASHSGISPERGVNAIVALARAVAALPATTPTVSINVAHLKGGTSLNVVPDRATLGIDVRSLDREQASATVAEIERSLRLSSEAAGCTIEIDVENPYHAYRLPPESEALSLAVAACSELGLDALPLETRGGSDANAFRVVGLDCVNLAHGVVDFHGPEERVAVSDLVLMEELVLGILARARDEAGSSAPGRVP